MRDRPGAPSRARSTRRPLYVSPEAKAALCEAWADWLNAHDAEGATHYVFFDEDSSEEDTTCPA
jgi:hypothetical protein